jgi:bifunctional enzyme CysN/CysC
MSAALAKDLSIAALPVPANDVAAAAVPQTLLRFITCGSVDDGKSTLIGRLLFEAGAVFEDQLSALDRDSGKFGTTGGRDFALLVDGLSAEREQGITIDVAYRYFATPRRAFIVADTPGHEQYTRNMATGASTADIAIILIDARKGVLPQTRRHSFMASMLGIRHAVIAVNKMDMVGYGEARFMAIRRDYEAMAADLGFASLTFIPLSAKDGDNVVLPSPGMAWYQGPSLLGHLETISIVGPSDEPFHFPVQWVNRSSQDFRGYAGQIASGRISVGDEIRVLPSGRHSLVSRIVTADGDREMAVAGETPTLCLADEIDISRGDIVVHADDPLRSRRSFTARLLVTGDGSITAGDSFLLKIGGVEAQATVEALHHRLDISDFSLGTADSLAMNAIGLVTLSLDRPIAVKDYATNRTLGGFILIDRISHDTVAFGLVNLLADTSALHVSSAATIAPPNILVRSLKRWMQTGGEQPRRSLVKAVTWRITGSIDTFLLSWLFTRSAGVAAAISATEVLTKLVLYYGHERIWARSAFGLPGQTASRAESTEGAGI